MKNIPNLFILGAPKTGTTALANNIAQHKNIFISEKKEPRFFDAHTFYDFEDDYIIKDLSVYISLFNTNEAIESKYKLDASVFNMYSKESIDNILKLSPNAKFIIILREPVAASLSMHRQRLGYADVKMREISEDFMECWDKLEDRRVGSGYSKGCRNKFLFRYDLLYSYELYLPYIIKTIKKENLFIGFYDDFIEEPKQFYSQVFKFLNIENISIENKKINKPKIVKKSKLLEYLILLSNSTLAIRKKIGLTGNKVNVVKKFIFSFFISTKVEKQKADKKVYDFFLETNKYLSELKKEYGIK